MRFLSLPLLRSALWVALVSICVSAAVATASEGQAGKTSSHQGRSTVGVIRAQLADVSARYRSGDVDAAKELLHETYETRFESIEGDLIEHDADLVTTLEEDFNQTLPQAMDQGVSADQFRQRVDQVDAKLERAQQMLAKDSGDHGAVFGDD